MPASFPLTFIGLHYWAGSSRAFDAISQLLAPNYPFLAPDLPGFGGATPSEANKFSVDAYADEVAAFIAGRKLKRYVLVPCLIVAGDQDAVMSPSVHGLETLPLLPEGTPLEIIKGAGHLLPYEAPQEVAALLRRFAERLKTA